MRSPDLTIQSMRPACSPRETVERPVGLSSAWGERVGPATAKEVIVWPTDSFWVLLFAGELLVGRRCASRSRSGLQSETPTT